MSIFNMISSIVGGGGSNARLLYSGSVTIPYTTSTSPQYADSFESTDSCTDKIVYFRATNRNTHSGYATALLRVEQIFLPCYEGAYNADPYLSKAWYRDDNSGDYGVVNYRTQSSSSWAGPYMVTFVGEGGTIYLSYRYDGYDIDGTWDWEIYEIDMDSTGGSGGGGGGGGGGGTAKNVQTNQTTSRTSSTSLTSVNSLTCSTAGTYDVYWTCDRSSTSGTWSSQLYLGGTAYGSEQTTWSYHVQTVHLSNVSISANQTVAVYVKARGTNYYGYAPQLTIVQS